MPIQFSYSRLNRIEKCIPLKWKHQIIKQSPKLVQNPKFCSVIIQQTDVDCVVMSEGLVMTLKDFATRGRLLEAFRNFSLIIRARDYSAELVIESLSSLLLSCTRFKLLSEGKQLHGRIITLGFRKTYSLVPKLVCYYTTLGLLDAARIIVLASDTRYVIPWNTLISSYVGKGRSGEAIYTYKEMVGKGIIPDHFTYPSVLKACAEELNLGFGREVHKSIISSSMDWNLFVQNALVSMYGKCGELETARTVFENMPIKDDISWNSIISAYASKGMWNEAFQLFESMQAVEMSNINVITWNTVAGGCLKTGNFKGALELLSQMRISGNGLDPVAVIIGLGACSHINAFMLGKEIHGLAIRHFFVDYGNVKNALVTLYSRCEDLKHANIVFRSVEAKSIITWNSIISGHAHWDCYEEASFLFRELLLTGIEPNYVTLAGILPLCARVANLQHGKEFHCYILRREGLHGYLLLWNSLIDMYARSGKVGVSRRMFDLLDKKDEVTYTSIIAGYGMQGEGRTALELFEEMIVSQIKPDHIAMVAVLSACSHSGLVAEGRLIFEKMQNVYGVTPNLDHYSCMADLFGRAGLVKKAKEVILSMPYKPTPEMWATLLGACRIHGDRDIGEWAAEKLMEMKPSNSGYYVLIANMYAAAGCWSKLGEVRTFMRDLGVRKDPGCAWLDIGAGFSPFLVEDSSCSQVDEIYLLLEGLTKQMKDIDSVSFDNSDAEEEIFLESLS